jgi:hypothetical protein
VRYRPLFVPVIARAARFDVMIGSAFTLSKIVADAAEHDRLRDLHRHFLRARRVLATCQTFSRNILLRSTPRRGI